MANITVIKVKKLEKNSGLLNAKKSKRFVSAWKKKDVRIFNSEIRHVRIYGKEKQKSRVITQNDKRKI